MLKRWKKIRFYRLAVLGTSVFFLGFMTFVLVFAMMRHPSTNAKQRRVQQLRAITEFRPHESHSLRDIDVET